MAHGRSRNFDDPDEVATTDGLRAEIVDVGGIAVARNVHDPGWRWSTHVRPVVGTEWCETRHVGYVVRGRLHVVADEGREEYEIGPGDVFHITPLHDAWVIGDKPFETIDWAGARTWLAPLFSPAERVLATLVFTDIVDSTRLANEMGPDLWSDLLAAYEEGVRDSLSRYGGVEVKTTGDGVLAMFDGTARAVRCALALVDMTEGFGFSIRAAVHVGEVERADRDLRGIAVHEAARVLAFARPREVLVSSLARDLAADPNLRFDPRGEHELKGLPGKRSLYAVTAS